MNIPDNRSLNDWLSWIVLAGVVLGMILIPFFLFETDINRWTDSLLNSNMDKSVVGALLGCLLAADIFLPVPSSITSTAAGTLLGLIPGALVSFVGMTAGCGLGLWFGAKVGAPGVRKYMTESQADRLRRAGGRYGVWALLIFRPAPVLAEASVLIAGAAGARIGPALAMCAVSNFLISIAYAMVGVGLV